MPSTAEHPLASVLRDAAAGSFPPVDGVVEIVPPDAAGTHAVVEFTGHAYVLTDRSRSDALFVGRDGFGGASHPRLLDALAGPMGQIGSHDMVLVRHADPADGDPLPETDAFDWHPRVARARHHRRDVRVLGDDRGLVCIGVGLVGRTEVSVEVTRVGVGGGAGRQLVLGALAVLPAGELVFAQVAPGNAASLRVFLACGFVPIGSEVLIEPDRHRRD
jgi:hypothetical protein